MAVDCANPLFLRWIGEWLETARERNSKGASSLKKAYDSMKACPLSFDHPSQAQQLHGLGPKLCDRLADRLKDHCIENNLPIPELPYKSRKRSSGTENDESTGIPPKRTRIPKPYVPTLRSGPYAIIIALSSMDKDSAQGLTKAQTIELAQEHCDSSFTAPSDPTKFYTAWNSMKTLLGKDLVYERGRPSRKYALTEDGWEVAKRIKNSTGRECNNQEKPLLSNQQSHQSQDPRGTSKNAPRNKVLDKENIVPLPPSRHQLDLSENAIEGASLGGWADIGSESGENYSWRNKSSRLQPVRAPLSCASISNGGSRNLHSNEENAPSVAPTKRAHGVAATEKCVTPIRSKVQDAEFIDLLSSPPAPSDVQRQTESKAKAPTSTLVEHDAMLGSATVNSHAAPISAPNAQFPAFQPINIPPSNFSVHLVLDNREVRSKMDRDYIQEELVKKGIKPITRALEVGDALWVAKCTDPGVLARCGEECDEVVLDWIVERKRLDDLIGSIKNGRFHEQKFRLRRSGVKNVIYIIEEISMNHEALGKFEEAVASAIASTQVVDGYYVKKTQKLDDTIRYLARMTMMLKDLYETKPLKVIPTPLLNQQSYLPLLSHLRKTQPSISYQISYSGFASLASKSDSLTVRDIFLKMLMCTRGVTGDKALEIQKYWKTPAGFIAAYERRDSENGRNDLLIEKMGNLVGRRKVGKILSAKVAAVWGEK